MLVNKPSRYTFAARWRCGMAVTEIGASRRSHKIYLICLNTARYLISGLKLGRIKIGARTPLPALAVYIGRIRLGGFVEHFKIVEHISYSTGTSRNFVEHKRCQ